MWRPQTVAASSPGYSKHATPGGQSCMLKSLIRNRTLSLNSPIGLHNKHHINYKQDRVLYMTGWELILQKYVYLLHSNVQNIYIYALTHWTLGNLNEILDM